ncbi:uncharacterized protein LOC123684920 [Harmonia axyridis]|uniref:uncharacterized protein LOC123684920 n=1 Tax=Harmonia axyridis TaxID=115357 RepID=UPI001E277AD9|nr:uncharacterized protein LOC123684920 [Harmonia axyridis]
MIKLILIFIVALAAIQHVDSIVCQPNTCHFVKCIDVSRENCCGPNKEIRDGFCGCCKICFTYLDEGEQCPPILYGGGPPTSGCKKGLKCKGGICCK